MRLTFSEMVIALILLSLLASYFFDSPEEDLQNTSITASTSEQKTILENTSPSRAQNSPTDHWQTESNQPNKDLSQLERRVRSEVYERRQQAIEAREQARNKILADLDKQIREGLETVSYDAILEDHPAHQHDAADPLELSQASQRVTSDVFTIKLDPINPDQNLEVIPLDNNRFQLEVTLNLYIESAYIEIMNSYYQAIYKQELQLAEFYLNEQTLSEEAFWAYFGQNYIERLVKILNDNFNEINQYFRYVRKIYPFSLEMTHSENEYSHAKVRQNQIVMHETPFSYGFSFVFLHEYAHLRSPLSLKTPGGRHTLCSDDNAHPDEPGLTHLIASEGEASAFALNALKVVNPTKRQQYVDYLKEVKQHCRQKDPYRANNEVETILDLHLNERLLTVEAN